VRPAAAIAALLLLTTAASARHVPRPEVWGERACADAGVSARVVRIDFESVQTGDPGIVIMEGFFHIKVHVTRVRFGTIASRDMEILFFAHAPAIYEGRRYNFNLRRRIGGLYIADCTQPDGAR
jgi:hypothetical protein